MLWAYNECSCLFKSSPPHNPPSGLTGAVSLKDFLYAEWKETACQLKTEGKAEIRAFLDHRWEPVTRKGEPRREQELQPTRRNMVLRAFTVWAPGLHQAPFRWVTAGPSKMGRPDLWRCSKFPTEEVQKRFMRMVPSLEGPHVCLHPHFPHTVRKVCTHV